MHALAEPPVTLDFAEYVATRRPALLRAARGITRDHHSAEDLLQSALARICTRWADIRDHRAADAYVRRTMVTQHASWYREKWRSREWVTAVLPEPAAPEPEQPRELWPLVVTLPPRQRSAVVLRYYEGLSEAETASVLGCSRGTVKSNTSRGVASLRASLRPNSGTPVPPPERHHP